jgi:hypothetical protein
MQNKGYQSARCTNMGREKWGFISCYSKPRHYVEISGQPSCASSLISEKSSLCSLNRRRSGHFGNAINLLLLKGIDKHYIFPVVNSTR